MSSRNRDLFHTDPSLELPEVPLTSVTTWDLRRLAAGRGKNEQPVVSAATKASVVGRLLRKLLDSFPFNVLIGDGGLIYILAGYRAAKKMVQEEGVTHVFSTFRPYSDHLIAYLLKRRFPHLFWVADFRDLHLDEKHGRQLLFWSFQLWCNRTILSGTDLLTTVSEGLARKLSQVASAVRLLRNGIPDIADWPQRQPTSYFSITYTGRIYPGEQNAELLFATLAEMIRAGKISADQIRLIYAGPTPELWQQWGEAHGLTAQLDIHGFLPLTQARQLQVNSTVNLQLAFSSVGQKGDLSSKVYEYLAAGNPILTIIRGEPDKEFETFFATFRPGQLIYDRPEDRVTLEAFILERYEAWQSGREEYWPGNQEAALAWRTDVLMDTFFDSLLNTQGTLSENEF
ncbi:MAG: hypothetical protein R2824_00085 [Saprospiraceae bacterium]|nr:hypothetical protein [Lewinella sp.]